MNSRATLEQRFTAHLQAYVKAGEDVILFMDVNEDVCTGSFCKQLAEIGLVEVSRAFLGDSSNTHQHGVTQIDGVWVTKRLQQGITGLILLPHSKSIGDHGCSF